eukprot:scaffold30248_cov62-Skeletonema_dohrnii-CCMP3373.AAC.1
MHRVVWRIGVIGGPRLHSIVPTTSSPTVLKKIRVLGSKIASAAAIRLDSNCKHAQYGPSLTIRLQILTEICNYYQSTRIRKSKRSAGRSKLVSYCSTADVGYRARSPLPLLFDLIAIANTHNMGQV